MLRRVQASMPSFYLLVADSSLPVYIFNLTMFLITSYFLMRKFFLTSDSANNMTLVGCLTAIGCLFVLRATLGFYRVITQVRRPEEKRGESVESHGTSLPGMSSTIHFHCSLQSNIVSSIIPSTLPPSGTVVRSAKEELPPIFQVVNCC